jgi:hypothetical protein
MMRIIQPFTKQDMISLHRTLLDTMKSGMTYKATTSAEEKIGVIRRGMGESIKGKTVYGNGNGSGEYRTLIESEPISIVAIRHWRLNYPKSFHRPFPLYPQSRRYHF